MRISTGSIVQFDIEFTIPKNSIFERIDVSDPLAAGLTYSSAQVFVDTVLTTTNVTNTSAGSNVAISLAAGISKALLAEKKVKISLRILVSDADALLAAIAAGVPDPANPGATLPLENIATIAAFDAPVAGNLLSQLGARSPLDFTECEIYGFGSSYSVEKLGGKAAYLIAAIPAVNSYANTDLVYKIAITANDEIDISALVNADVTSFIGGPTQIPVANTWVYDAPSNTVSIEFSQTDAMKGLPVYVAVKGTTKATIVNLPSTTDTLTNHATAELYFDANGDGTLAPTELVCESPHFTITTTLVELPPSITLATKTIV